MTLIASHRGGALEWPENTPTAFRATAGLSVDQVEFDIHPTADGEIVVFHDATLERTSNGVGEVAAHTLAELKALTLVGTEGEHMLTLAEFATLFAPTGIALRMELKSDARKQPYPGLLTKALAVLDEKGLRTRTIVTSFNVAVAAQAAATEGLIAAIWLVAPDVQERVGPAGIISTALGHGVSRVGIRCSHLDAVVLRDLRQGGLGVGSWAANDAMQIADMLALGVDVFTTDRPTLALLLRDGVQPMQGVTEVASLTAVSQDMRDRLMVLPNTRAAHVQAHAAVMGRAVVIGGDLNTKLHGPDEALFTGARARGFDWRDCNVAGPTTRASSWSEGAGDFKLDWICTRGFVAQDPVLVPAVDDDGTVLSDHDLVLVTLRVA